MKTLEYRVFGPPGTGKTTWISGKVRDLAEQIGGDQISVCSMTRAAVKEIVGRDIPVPEDNISTLHARCKRALGTGHPAESIIKKFVTVHPKHSNELTLPLSLLRGAVEGTSADEVMLSGRGISFYERAQILRQQMVPKKNWPKQVLNWYSVWNGWCVTEGVLDFTGWLEETMRQDALPPQHVLFVDEAQDHTPLQIAVIRSWNVRHRILVGDDDQGIYEWSGAVPMTFLSPELPSSREKVLSQSYRVPAAVHELASKWINQVRMRKHKDYASKEEIGEVVWSDTQLSEIKYNPEALLDHMIMDGRTHMILTSCGFQLTDIIVALKKLGIPFHNEYRRSNKGWNPLESPLRILQSFMVGDRDWTGEEVIEWASIIKARALFKRAGQKRLIDACEEIGEDIISEELLQKCILPGKLIDVMNQDPIIFDDRKIGVAGDWKYAMGVVKKYGINVEPKVTVGTIHSVKGGEADDVLLFPDLSAAGNRDYLGYSRDGIIRLFYVGMTRAKNRLILGDASTRNSVNWRI